MRTCTRLTNPPKGRSWGGGELLIVVIVIVVVSVIVSLLRLLKI